MSKEKKTPARKYNNPSPYNSKPKFGQMKLPEVILKIQPYKAGLEDENVQMLINPLEVITLVKSVCKTCHMFCSPTWRTSEEIADQDAAKHIELGHWTDYMYRYVTEKHS